MLCPSIMRGEGYGNVLSEEFYKSVTNICVKEANKISQEQT